MIQWDGENIVGGEPLWFQEAARAGIIERSADGVGSVLFIRTIDGILKIMPGDWLFRSKSGEIFALDRPSYNLYEIFGES